MKVTIAIPIYNAARHINVTLDSLVHQTMLQEDFEIICVNDCSTDRSIEVIESYMDKLSNLTLINRKENSGGPMIPRNDAIAAAKGEYILFLDNDDFLGEETLERFYQSAKENQSDVIYGKYIGVNGRRVPQSMFQKGNLANADIIEDHLVYSLAPHKMFRLELIKQHHLAFHPKAVVGEDQLFVMQCYIEAKVITVLTDYDYYYVVSRGNENLSLKYFPVEQFYFSFNRILEYIKESSLNQIYKEKLQVAFLNRFFHASRLRRYLFTNILTYGQKKEWLAETCQFIDRHIDENIASQLANRFKYLVQLMRKNDIDLLLQVHNEVEKVTFKEVSRVENGYIYAKFQQVNKKYSFDEELIVNHKNTSEVYVKELSINNDYLMVKGQFSQSLLINFQPTFHMIYKHRASGLEKKFAAFENEGGDVFHFRVPLESLVFHSDLLGPWDLFVEATIGNYTKRRRIGAKRAGNIGKKFIIPSVDSFGSVYTIKTYFTKPQDNISLDIKSVEHGREIS